MNRTTASFISNAMSDYIYDFFKTTGRVFGTVDQSLHFIAEELGEACRAWNAMSDTPFLRNNPENNVKSAHDFIEELGDIIMMALVTSMVCEDALGENALDAMLQKIERKISEATVKSETLAMDDEPTIICDTCALRGLCTPEEVESAERLGHCVECQPAGGWLNPNEWDVAQEQDALEMLSEEDLYIYEDALPPDETERDALLSRLAQLEQTIKRQLLQGQIDEMFERCDCWTCRQERGEPVEVVTATIMTSEQIKQALHEIDESDRFIRLHSGFDDALSDADFAVRNASA